MSLLSRHLSRETSRCRVGSGILRRPTPPRFSLFITAAHQLLLFGRRLPSQSEFTRRVLHSATLARDRAQQRKTQRDTLPLQLELPDGDSAVVLVRFGSEPGPNDGVAHFAAQERDVLPLRSNRPPAYPSTLNSEGVEGEVVVAFVVRPDSAPDMSTLRVLRSSHPDFTKSVLESVARNRYVPLELDCHVYPVLVQQPSAFHMRP